MNVFVRTETVFRIQQITGKPISSGMDKAISEILDDYEILVQKTKRVVKQNQSS